MKELRIKDICTKGSSTLRQKDVEKLSGKYPVYGASGLIAKMDSYHQEKDYIAIVKDGSGIGRVMFLPAKSSVIGTMQYILPKEGYDIFYIGYCLQSLNLSSYKQGAAIPHIYFRDYGERIVKVTDSISEQKDIVNRINVQFSKIDKLKQNAEKELQEVLSCLKATISQATSFRNGWNLDTLGELSTIKGDYGLAAPSRPYDISKNDFRYLRITDITEWGELNDDIVAADIDSDIKQEPLAEGDILFARTGATVGKTLIYRKDFGDCLFAGYLIRYRLDKKRILPRYMFYVTHSDIYYKWVAQKQKVAAQPNISAKLYNQYPIAYPSVEEQKVIISDLDHIFSKVMLLQTSYDKITKECEALKQSILREIFD